MKRTSLITLSTILLILSLWQCKNQETKDDDSWLGTYQATRLYVADTAAGFVGDIVQLGGAFELQLKQDETFSSTLFLPESLAQAALAEEGGELPPGDLTIEVDGNFQLQGQKLSFSHEEDFFLRDLDNWKLSGNKISCQDTIGGPMMTDLGVILVLPYTIYDIEMIKQE